MIGDMTEKVMEDTNYGRAALAKIGPVSENFRLFKAGWVGNGHPKDSNGMVVLGAEYRSPTRGPNVGRLTMEVPGTRRKVYLSREEIRAAN